MNIDHTKLLKALKQEEPHDIPDKEKIEAANELHEWLTGDAEKSSEKK